MKQYVIDKIILAERVGGGGVGVGVGEGGIGGGGFDSGVNRGNSPEECHPGNPVAPPSARRCR